MREREGGGGKRERERERENKEGRKMSKIKKKRICSDER